MKKSTRIYKHGRTIVAAVGIQCLFSHQKCHRKRRAGSKKPQKHTTSREPTTCPDCMLSKYSFKEATPLMNFAAKEGQMTDEALAIGTPVVALAVGTPVVHPK